MQWFKHYSGASGSLSLNHLIEELGVEGYGRYWLLLELLAEEFDGESAKFRVHFNKISAKLHVKFGKKLETFLQKLADFQLIQFRVAGKVYEIEAPILLELQSRDFKKARSERADTAPKIKNKIKIKELDKEKSIKGAQTKFVHPKSYDEFLGIFPLDVQSHWLEIYDMDKDWVLRELKECYAYFYIKKTKKPSASIDGWVTRASGWLKRGWESYSKSSAPRNVSSLKNLVKSEENLAWASSFANTPALKEIK